MVVVPLAPIVVVALGEVMITLLLLLIGSSLHHVAELCDCFKMITAEVAVDVFHGEAVLEAVLTVYRHTHTHHIDVILGMNPHNTWAH